MRKSRGAVEVLSDENFEVEPGGFLTLLGPSGCGKSTILRLVSGLDEISGGQILISGNDVARLPAAERKIGMVFQDYALFPHMTIAGNITFGLNVRKVAKADKENALARVAELMGLGTLLDRTPAQLSGGQQQRVAPARVLVSERPLVLMDEPLSNLDAKLRVEIRSEIRSLNKRLGITVVYVTHDQSETLSMSDKVVLMNGGQVSQCGTPHELYEKPANTFAASFIGTPPMNLLPTSCRTTETSFDQKIRCGKNGSPSASNGTRVPRLSICLGNSSRLTPCGISCAYRTASSHLRFSDTGLISNMLTQTIYGHKFVARPTEYDETVYLIGSGIDAIGPFALGFQKN